MVQGCEHFRALQMERYTDIFWGQFCNKYQRLTKQCQVKEIIPKEIIMKVYIK